MQLSLIRVLATGVALAACGVGSVRSDVAPDQPGFRVRSDFAVGLNSDSGWSGELNENVTIYADRPFRIRFETELAAGSTDGEQFRLQYRRNEGDWTDIRAYDFPLPGEVEIDFARSEVGSAPSGWTVSHGNAAGLSIAQDEHDKFLRAEADQTSLIGLYPWPSELPEFEFDAEVRLANGNQSGIGFVFGYAAPNDYCRVFLDVAGDAVRVSRFHDGREKVIAEQRAEITPDRWLEISIEFEDGELEVSLEDEELEFTADMGTVTPTTSLGFHVPADETAEFKRFEIEGMPRTPRVSIVSCPAYENGAATVDLLTGSSNEFRAGTGISFANHTCKWSPDGGHGEFEWPLVVRRFADGPVTNEPGDSFEFRMVTTGGRALRPAHYPLLQLAIAAGHVGGTFVETPGRIGPWQASNGDLYFILEPAETENVFMMVKSTDNGRTWHEVDGTHRPWNDDLEGVDARLVEDTIHIVHEVTHALWYHAFCTSDHATRPDSWVVRDQLAARTNAAAQAAALVVRSDGSLVAFYVGPTKIHYKVRSPEGTWSSQTAIDPDTAPNLTGPQAVLGANDTVHLAYYATNGTIWYRALQHDGTLSRRQKLATGLGTTRAEFGSVLPLLFIPETNTLVIIYRSASGELWERRIRDGAPPSEAVRVTDRKVVQNAVDSQQPGADAVLDGTTLHVLFIEESSRAIFSTNDKNGWQPAKLRVDNILGSWIRGDIYTRPDGTKVYGYVYDAGSGGGAGMNRFGEIRLRQTGRPDAQ